jgi:hypothetical protein
LVLVNKKSLGEAILKYVENMDLKMKLMVWMESPKKNSLFKKTTLKTNFGCESYALLKKCINGNQRATWQVGVGPCGDAPPLIFPISSLLSKLLMK